MAIGKTKQLGSGISGDYWKITSEVYERVSGRIHWQIALYKDKAASDAGKQHLGLVKSYCTTISREDAAGNRTLFGYTFIRAKAASMVTPIFGGEPIMFDPDLANGEIV